MRIRALSSDAHRTSSSAAADPYDALPIGSRVRIDEFALSAGCALSSSTATDKAQYLK